VADHHPVGPPAAPAPAAQPASLGCLQSWQFDGRPAPHRTISSDLTSGRDCVAPA
jgi:hypothetical protein